MKLELLKGSRSRILAAIVLVIAAIFIVRLFYLQIIQHDHYAALANQEQMTKERIPAKRGLIYARDGDNAPLAIVRNETVYTAFADPFVIAESERGKIIDVLKRVAGGNLRTGFESLLEKSESRYQILATKLTRVQADKIKEEGLRGIGFQAVSQRVYPEGSLAGQVLGFVNTEGKGTYGVESYLNDELMGTDGRLETVTDVSDVPLTIGDRNIREPAKDGTNIVLTIDRNIQSHAEQALAAGLARTGAKNGSILVMDPKTGKVMAMANLPSYNPGEYFKVTDSAQFNNGVISAPYEPGSDVKTFTMAAGLDKGVVKPTDTFNNTDYITIDGWTITNATKGITGTIDFQKALTYSLNTGFVTVAQRLGDGSNITRSARDTMYNYFHDRFRLGELTGIELANEARGILYSPETGEGNAVKYATMAFGQGLNATIVQVTAGFSAMINGGNYYKPTILDGVMEGGSYKPNQTPQPIASGIVSKATSDQMVSMIQTVREQSLGRVEKPGYVIGGKTGTSQVSKEDGTGYKDDEAIGTYLGFGGAETPEYVIMVAVSGKGQVLRGAQDAGPIFTDMSNWLINYLKIQPKG